MSPGDWTYLLMAVSPVGGLLVAIPWGVFEREYPWLVLVTSGPPLAYLQVVIVDTAFHQLERLAFWRDLLTKRRNARIDRLLQSGGSFWPVFMLTPLVGPWFIMGVMRYAGIPQRRIALPIFASLMVLTALLVAACVSVPGWFGR
jgi:hypothetical protein